jgi:hypothetical protein
MMTRATEDTGNGLLPEQIAHWPTELREAWLRFEAAKQVVEQLQAAIDLNAASAQASDLADDIGGDTLDAEASEGATDRQVLELDYQLQLASIALERARAAVDMRVRQMAQASGVKLTEAAVEARVVCDPQVMAAEQQVVDAKHALAVTKLERDDRWQRARSSAGAPWLSAAATESEEVRSLREQLAQAQHAMDLALIEVRYQRARGRSLGMLVRISTPVQAPVRALSA